eukprot:Colp12_sorted_trinity150504_noHs@6728
MACCTGSAEERVANEVNEKINKDLKKYKKVFQNELRLLLLGAGESGKSTIVKQMRIIHSTGFSRDEREQLKDTIFSNILQSMKAMVEACTTLGVSVEEDNKDSFVYVENLKDSDTFTYDDIFFDHVDKLWKDKGIQVVYSRSNEYQLNDSTKYFLDNLDRIRGPSYLPTDQDVLQTRVVTSGIFEFRFTVNDVQFLMCDVGGQRSERRKWIQCFGDVTGIIFVVASSGYDQVLREDPSQNRLKEALELFGSIWKNRWLERVSVVLFLNKVDQLLEKIEVIKSDLKSYFPDYTGGFQYEAASQYILQKFLEIGKGNEYKRVYPHYTIATNTDNIRKVFDDVKDIIQNVHLREYGLL